MTLDLRLRAFLWFVQLTGATDTGAGGTGIGRPQRLARMRAQRPPAGQVSDWLLGPVAPQVRRIERELPGRDGPLRVALFRPDRPDGAALPVVVAFHGGGWALGDNGQGDRLHSQVAARTGALVVAVDYRLAPEHPYPAARRDATDALRAVVDLGPELGADPTRLAVLGDSAGGNLAAVACLDARDAGGPALACQVLLYPAVDAVRETGRLPGPGEQTALLRESDAEAFLHWYLAGTGDPADPGVSPLRADSLAGLPPALVVTAGHDLLGDTGRRYARRLAEEGVPVRHRDYPDMPHGFVSLPGVCRGAGPALAEVCDVLRQALLLPAPGADVLQDLSWL